MVASITGGGASNRVDSIFSKLDTKNQGYLDKADLQSALGAVEGSGSAAGPAVDVDDTFSALDGDSDGKVTKSELSDAMTKLSDQLNAQFDAGRVARGTQTPEGGDSQGGGVEGMGGAGAAAGPRGAGGPHGGGRAGGAGSTESTEETDETSSTYVAAADTDGDGTVSEDEQAAYDKKVASGEIDKGGAERALNLLKAYADDAPANDSGISVNA